MIIRWGKTIYLHCVKTLSLKELRSLFSGSQCHTNPPLSLVLFLFVSLALSLQVSPSLSVVLFVCTALPFPVSTVHRKESHMREHGTPYDGSRGHTHHSALADICSLSVEEGNTIRLLGAIHHPQLWLCAWSHLSFNFLQVRGTE